MNELCAAITLHVKVSNPDDRQHFVPAGIASSVLPLLLSLRLGYFGILPWHTGNDISPLKLVFQQTRLLLLYNFFFLVHPFFFVTYARLSSLLP